MYGKLTMRETLGSNIPHDCLLDVTLPASDLSKITSNHARVRNDRYVNRANIIRYHEIPSCRELHQRQLEVKEEGEEKSERATKTCREKTTQVVTLLVNIRRPTPDWGVNLQRGIRDMSMDIYTHTHTFGDTNACTCMYTVKPVTYFYGGPRSDIFDHAVVCLALN